jgi:predicted amidohydrolase YtcJ
MAAIDREAPDRADLIVRNAKVTSLHDGGSAVAEAIAVLAERFAAVGSEAEVMRLGGEDTRVVDAGGRRVIPGLNDSHLHAIRGGLHYNLELRWDGVGSLARGLEMIREQAERTPEGQWVRVNHRAGSRLHARQHQRLAGRDRVGTALAPRLSRTAAPDEQRDEPAERSRQLLHDGLAVVPEHAR